MTPHQPLLSPEENRYVYIRLTRPEGYEDVHPELVLEDAKIDPAFQPEVIEAAVLARVAPKEPVTAMSPELDAATLWLAEARDTLRRLGDDANRHLTAVLYAAMDASHQEGAKLQTDGREKG
jgi:hypothetical protein